MRYILLATAFAATSAWATMNSERRRCRDALHTTTFFKKAPEPREIVGEYIEHMGPQIGAVVGPESIRHRLDRAFARYLLQRFNLLELGLVAGEEVMLETRTFRVTKITAKDLVIHDVAAPRAVLDWSARHGYGEPTAAKALDIDDKGERADTWLDMDPGVGIALLAALIEKHWPLERRIELRTEIDVWARYVEDIRLAFNRNPKATVRLGTDFRPLPRTVLTLH